MSTNATQSHVNSFGTTQRLGGVDEVVQRYDAHPRSIYRWADLGLIPPGFKLGVLRKWNLEEIDKHIAAGCPKVRTMRGGAR